MRSGLMSDGGSSDALGRTSSGGFPRSAEQTASPAHYEWSAQQIDAMAREIDQLNIDGERPLGEKLIEKLKELATQALGFVAGGAFSAATINEIFPPGSHSGVKKDGTGTGPGVLTSLYFVAQLLLITVVIFFGAYRLKKKADAKSLELRQVGKELRMQQSSSMGGGGDDLGRTQTQAVRDGENKTAETANKLLTGFADKFFHNLFGGWAYSIMFSWTVLIQYIFDFKFGKKYPQREAWLWFFIAAVVAVGATVFAYEYPPKYVLQQKRKDAAKKGLTKDRVERLEFVAELFKGKMCWLLALFLVQAAEYSLALTVNGARTASELFGGDVYGAADARNKMKSILTDMSLLYHWIFFGTCLLLSALVLTVCNRYGKDWTESRESEQLYDHATGAEFTVMRAQRKKHVYELMIGTVGLMSSLAVWRALKPTLKPCKWTSNVSIKPSEIKKIQCNLPGVQNATAITNLFKDIEGGLDDLYCNFNNQTQADFISNHCRVPCTDCLREGSCTDAQSEKCESTDFGQGLRGFNLTAVTVEETQPLYGSSTAQLAFGLAFTVLMAVFMLRLQARVSSKLREAIAATLESQEGDHALDDRARDAARKRQQADFFITLWGIAAKACGAVIGLMWSEFMTFLFDVGGEGEGFFAARWWTYAILWTGMSIVGSLALATGDLRAICRKDVAKAVMTEVESQFADDRNARISQLELELKHTKARNAALEAQLSAAGLVPEGGGAAAERSWSSIFDVSVGVGGRATAGGDTIYADGGAGGSRS